MAISAKKAIESVEGTRGFVTSIAKRLGCSRSNVYALMKKYPTFKQAIEDERETLKDFAEGKLFQQIDDGNTTAIIFYLKTQAKDRGYVEKQEVEFFVRRELEAMLDTLERKLDGDTYNNVLSVIAGDSS